MAVVQKMVPHTEHGSNISGTRLSTVSGEPRDKARKI